ELGAATGERIGRDATLAALLRRPEVTLERLAALVDLGEDDPAVRQQVEIETKYEGYIRRQEEEIARVRRHESIELPADLDYAAIPGLSRELVEKLGAARPATLARAARIPGITPAALSLLLVQARRRAGNGIEAGAAAPDAASGA